MTQFNSALMFTIDDSNLADFSDAAVFVHPDSLDPSIADWTAAVAPVDLPPFPARGRLVGEPVDLYMYNDTISNSAKGVHINSVHRATIPPATRLMGDAPQQHVLQRRYAIQTIAPQFDGKNPLAIVNVLAMNNIFDGSSKIAVNLQGQANGRRAGG